MKHQSNVFSRRNFMQAAGAAVLAPAGTRAKVPLVEPEIVPPSYIGLVAQRPRFCSNTDRSTQLMSRSAALSTDHITSLKIVTQNFRVDGGGVEFGMGTSA